MNVEPVTMDFTHFTPTTTFPWSLNWLIANEGPTNLQVTNIIVGGPDAAAFRLTTMRDDPAPTTATIAPASSEGLRVKFCPKRRGQFSATVQVLGDSSADPSHPSPVSGMMSIVANAPPDPIPLCP
jgi:hypothetical protein